MIWLKCILGGVTVAVFGGGLFLALVFVKLRRESHSRSIGVDASLFRNPFVVAFLLLLFAAGFAVSFCWLK